MEEKRIYIKKDNRKIAGVCSGIADFMHIDPTIIRLIFAILVLFFGTGIVLYIIAVLILPQKNEGAENQQNKIETIDHADMENEKSMPDEKTAEKNTTNNNTTMKKKIYRLKDNRKIAGVCSGLADYFEIDPTIVRLAWLIAVLCYGFGLLAYLVAIIVIPNKPDQMQ